MLKTLIIDHKHSKSNIKLLLYKFILKPIWIYGLQLWFNAKFSNLNKIRSFQNITLRKITNCSPYVSNHTLHSDLHMQTIHKEAKSYHKWFYLRLNIHPNSLIKNQTTLDLPRNPPHGP